MNILYIRSEAKKTPSIHQQSKSFNVFQEPIIYLIADGV